LERKQRKRADLNRSTKRDTRDWLLYSLLYESHTTILFAHDFAFIHSFLLLLVCSLSLFLFGRNQKLPALTISVTFLRYTLIKYECNYKVNNRNIPNKCPNTLEYTYKITLSWKFSPGNKQVKHNVRERERERKKERRRKTSHRKDG